MRNLSAYSMFFGILIVTLSGNWIIRNYDSVSIYPKASYITFGIGLALVVGAFMMNKFSTYHEDENLHKKDNRDVLNKWVLNNYPINNWVIGIIIFPLVIAPFYTWVLFFQLFSLYIFLGIVLASLVFILKGDRVEEEWGWAFKGKTKKLFDLIDYRKHPFNISLIIYILVIVSFVLSKHWGIPFYMETRGNPRYVTSLPRISLLMSCLMVYSTFTYIISQGNIFGFHKAKLNYDKVIFILLLEIVYCGGTLFYLVFTVLNALYVYF